MHRICSVCCHHHETAATHQHRHRLQYTYLYLVHMATCLAPAFAAYIPATLFYNAAFATTSLRPHAAYTALYLHCTMRPTTHATRTHTLPLLPTCTAHAYTAAYTRTTRHALRTATTTTHAHARLRVTACACLLLHLRHRHTAMPAMDGSGPTFNRTFSLWEVPQSERPQPLASSQKAENTSTISAICS